MTKPSILVVEDEQPIRTMVRYALEAANFTVLEAEDAKQAQHLIADKLPHLVLLDWMLPQTSGIDFTKQLKQQKLTQNIPIIMLTAKAEEDSRVMGLDVGADDYIVKPFSPRELIARIKAVLRRGALVQPDEVLCMQQLKVDTRSHRVTINNENVKLGPLEFKLLTFFLKHPDRVYSRDELLTHVWGGAVYIDERTVDVHIRRLRKILAKGGYEKMIQTVHGSGYRFSEHYE